MRRFLTLIGGIVLVCLAGGATALAVSGTITLSGNNLQCVQGTTTVSCTGTKSIADGQAITVSASADPSSTTGSTTVLVGDQTLESTADSNPDGYAQAWSYTAAASGKVSSANVYVDSGNSGSITVGLYSDANGKPGSLLGASQTISSPTVGAWNQAGFSNGPSVTSGTKYWLAILGTGSGNFHFRDQRNGTCTTAGARSSSSLPSTWSNAFSVTGWCPASVYLTSGSSGSSTTTTPTTTTTTPSTTTTTPSTTTTTPTTTTPPSNQPVGDPLGKTWTQTFDDEFNGTSIDTSKWAALNGWANNNITSSSSDCTESGGNLVLLLPGNGTGCDLSSAPGYGAGPNGYTLPVGGYLEARIWFPGPGSSPTATLYNFPAFWALGVNPGGSGEGGGEIDIAEAINNMQVNYHSNSANTHVADPAGNWGNSWHVYGVYRSATKDQIFYDGNLVGTVTTADNGGPETILFTSGQTGGCCGGPVQYGSAANVLVDWVHAWQ